MQKATRLTFPKYFIHIFIPVTKCVEDILGIVWVDTAITEGFFIKLFFHWGEKNKTFFITHILVTFTGLCIGCLGYYANQVWEF